MVKNPSHTAVPRSGALNTRQRAAIWQALAGREVFVSAQQLHTELQAAGHTVGLATVYRGLQAMVQEDLIDVIHDIDGSAMYRRCTTGHHHHHLICRICRRTIEIDDHASAAWIDQLAGEHNFTDVEHILEVFGVCSNCRV